MTNILLILFLLTINNNITLAFVTNKIIKYNKNKLYSNINTNIDSNNIINKFIGKPIGDYWTYENLIDNINKNNVDSVSLLNDKSGIIAIDKTHSSGIYNPENIHYIKYNSYSLDDLIRTISKNNIHIDLLELKTQNTPISQISQIGMQIGEFVISYIVIILFINIIRGVFFGNKIGGPSPMDFMNGNSRGITDSGNFFNQNENNLLTMTTFNDVAGCEEAKYELEEIVDFLKNPIKYEEAGAKIPTGVLLEGNPGTGKTLLARAVAGEAGVPFISASGSEFIEMFVGVGASRVRNLFEKAKKNSPCVVFIDEIDAVGRQRGAGIAGGNDEREQTLNQILTNMDGFETSDGIIVLAATNRVDILDKALVRPGRFDRKVNVGLPDYQGRIDISKIHFKDKKLDKNASIEKLSSLMTGFSGADIANLANEAAILSVRKNETNISKDTLYDAFEKVTIGIKAFRQETNPKIIELVTYHEVGHALMVAIFNEMFNLQKITINSNKSGAGGYTLFTPKEQYAKYPSKKFLLANLIIALGGRAAEIYLGEQNPSNNINDKKIFKNFNNLDITTGATNDLKQAYNIAKEYITTYGFGEELNLKHEENNDLPFLGRDLYTGIQNNNNNDNTEKQINKLLKFACSKAYELIISNENAFINIIEILKKERTIDGNIVNNILETI